MSKINKSAVVDLSPKYYSAQLQCQNCQHREYRPFLLGRMITSTYAPCSACESDYSLTTGALGGMYREDQVAHVQTSLGFTYTKLIV